MCPFLFKDSKEWFEENFSMTEQLQLSYMHVSQPNTYYSILLWFLLGTCTRDCYFYSTCTQRFVHMRYMRSALCIYEVHVSSSDHEREMYQVVSVGSTCTLYCEYVIHLPSSVHKRYITQYWVLHEVHILCTVFLWGTCTQIYTRSMHGSVLCLS